MPPPMADWDFSVIHRATYSLAHSPKETPCLRKLSPTCHPGELYICVSQVLPAQGCLYPTCPRGCSLKCSDEHSVSRKLKSKPLPPVLSVSLQDFRPCHMYCLEERSPPSNPVRLMCPGCFSAPHHSSKNSTQEVPPIAQVSSVGPQVSLPFLPSLQGYQ